ncbi:Glucan 1,4-alpha-maltohexaosidase [Gossypium arboreum]|uniref:Glucan 1,4-alpha-maltohexaosidase n=1 Tax=Gossypium arboreum TaxID=29729 RepID=A0A0B0NL80_GOSAR|nr:Glucan 1,4-alpha-maltohexaosidase [Gossypium arboreum]KHG13510.1 Glucan 1,4-alpha-maltohexaosidase [Gossypium arboreum]KHG22141.1 Glucan 1,4-alpha-maltohexaosidase [Gossypium arboreum]
MALASYYVNKASRVSFSISNGSIGSPRIFQGNDKYRQASSGIKGHRRLVHTINLDLLGIVSLNILNMACI